MDDTSGRDGRSQDWTAGDSWWADESWGDSWWQDDGSQWTWTEDRQPASDSKGPSAGSRPSNPGTSKYTSWLSDEEYQAVFHFPRGQPQLCPKGKKHDFNQLQRISAYHVATAEAAKSAAEAAKSAMELEIAELQALKWDAEKAVVKEEERASAAEAKVQQLLVLLEAKNRLIGNYAASHNQAMANVAKFFEDMQGLSWQLEIVDEENEDLQTAIADSKEKQDQMSCKLEALEKELQQAHAENKGLQESLVQKVARYKGAIAKWDLKVRQLRERVAKAKLEVQLRKAVWGLVQLISQEGAFRCKPYENT